MAKKRVSENRWVFIKNSGIHGCGVFAKRKIPAETRIMEYFGERISKKESNRRGIEQMEKATKDHTVGAVYIFDLNKRWDIDGNVPENIARFANHSCEENCEAINENNRIFYYSTKTIEEGEEILIDYGYALEHFLDHPCRCGAKHCVGYIVAKDSRKKLKKMVNNKKTVAVAKKGKRVAKKK